MYNPPSRLLSQLAEPDRSRIKKIFSDFEAQVLKTRKYQKLMVLQKEKYTEKLNDLTSQNEILRLQVAKQHVKLVNCSVQTVLGSNCSESFVQTGDCGMLQQKEPEKVEIGSPIGFKIDSYLSSMQDEISRTLPDFSFMSSGINISLGNTKNLEREQEIKDVQKELNQPKYTIHPVIRREKIAKQQINLQEDDQDQQYNDVSVLSIIKGKGRSLVHTNGAASNLQLSGENSAGQVKIKSADEQIIDSIVTAEEERKIYQNKVNEAEKLTQSIQKHMWKEDEMAMMKIKKPIIIKNRQNLADTGINLHVSNAKLTVDEDYNFFE